MSVHEVVTLVYALHVLIIENASSLSNSEMVNNNTCKFNLDCNKPASDSFSFSPKPYYCKCDSDCINYGDCCLDAPTYDPLQQILNANNLGCIATGTWSFHYMKTGCEVEWEHTEVSRLCAAATPWNIVKDPLLSLPVTSNHTNRTYPNIYCALCNNEVPSLHTWDAYTQCRLEKTEDWELIISFFEMNVTNSGHENKQYKSYNFTDLTYGEEKELYRDLSESIKAQNYVKANLRFSGNDKDYEVSVNKDNKMVKFTCPLFFRIPDLARECNRYVQTCDFSWQDNLTSYQCQSYLYPVFDKFNRIAYRNPHCALCNHVPSDNLTCYYKGLPYLPALLSVLLSVPDSPKTDLPSSSCGDGKFFVPAYSSCQSTLCRLSSEIHRNGVCVNHSILVVSNDNSSDAGKTNYLNYSLNGYSNGNIPDRISAACRISLSEILITISVFLFVFCR